MNSINGCYFIYNFFRRLSTRQKNAKFLYQIFDQIQQELYQMKKQLPTAMFNNDTKYIKFVSNKSAKNKTNGKALYIQNPMILFIGIAFYDKEPLNPDVDIYANDLDGIDRDYDNLKTACEIMRWNFPQEQRYEWNKKELIEFLTAQSETFHQRVNDNDVDGLLVVISGHAFQRDLLTSDYKLLSLTDLHRLFSNEPTSRNIPRLFICDISLGDSALKYYGKSDEVKSNEDEQNRHDEINTQTREYWWWEDEPHPDYKLGLIFAANEKFQSKTSSDIGSYLTYQFVWKMCESLRKKKK
eukprot:392046_1